MVLGNGTGLNSKLKQIFNVSVKFTFELGFVLFGVFLVIKAAKA